VINQKHRAVWNVDLMASDMALRGWAVRVLAERSGKNYHTVNKFLLGTVQTPKTAKAIAQALGHSTRRYLLRVEVAA
jgi:lambda repressor-like predicted transcriptional regulator